MYNLLLMKIFVMFFLCCSAEKVEKTEQIQDLNNLKSDNAKQRTYNIDLENSSVKWTGKKITKSHSGSIDINSGTILMQGKKVISAEIKIDMNSIQNTSINNQNSRYNLTSHLKNEDFFNVDSFPISIIKINNATELNDSTYIFNSDLTIKGITNPVEFTGNIFSLDGKYLANIDLTFDRTLWNIRYGSGKFFDNLGDRIILDEIHISASLLTN